MSASEFGVSQFLLDRSRKFTSFSDTRKYEALLASVDQVVSFFPSSTLSGCIRALHLLRCQPKLGTSDYQEHELASLESQLDKFDSAVPVDPTKSSLHMLLHRWTPAKRGDRLDYRMPFKDYATLEKVTKRLQLPRCYAYDYGRRQQVPACMTMYQHGLGEFLLPKQVPCFLTSFCRDCVPHSKVWRYLGEFGPLV